MAKRASFGFLGFEFRRVRRLQGKWQPYYSPKLKQRTVLLRKLKEVFRRFDSQASRPRNQFGPRYRGVWEESCRESGTAHQPDSARLGQLLYQWQRQSLLRFYPRLGGEEGGVAPVKADTSGGLS